MQLKLTEPQLPSLASYGQLVLFGDSITEAAWTTEYFSFGASLAHAYSRRLDVINRGFSGYTSRQALALLPRLFPARDENVKLVVLFFGANDAVLPGNMQHVPLQEYVANIAAIASSEQLKGKVLVVTPPPVNEHMTGPERRAKITREYAEALRMWCKDHAVPVSDLWSDMMTMAGWKSDDPLTGSKVVPQDDFLGQCLRDGLHPSGLGYQIINQTIKTGIGRFFPELAADTLEMHVPHWRQVFNPPIGTHTRYRLETGWWQRAEAAQLYALLHPSELAAVRSFIFPHDQEMALGSFLLQKYFISHILAKAWRHVKIERDAETRRPFCANRDVRPHDYNVSHHAESVVLAGLVDGDPVGIDLTQAFEDDKSLEDFKDVFTQREWAAIAGKRERFQQHWAIKEALVKAAGVGIVGNLLNIEALKVDYVSPYEPVCTTAVGALTINEPWGPGSAWQVELHALPRDRTVAVAYRASRPIEPLPFTELSVADILKEASRTDLF